MSDKKVITRFAPSPTGMLHIGGARTALFNRLFAKQNGGKFLLRIEDTDKERSTEEAKDAILNGMLWLGLTWDGDPVFQSSRKERHLSVVNQMIENGFAYLDYEKKVENEDGIKTTIKTEMPAIRIKIPDGITTIEDEVHGKIEFNNKDIEDFVLVRSNGEPTYMFCVVVDDIDMGITHIIRGDDHLSNTPKQVLIYNALGARLPKFAHIPLIHDIEGKKLSKRKNAVAVQDYKDMGYLPSAIKNYLLQLGWHCPEKDLDVISEDEVEKAFSLGGINKSPSRFDFDKLNNINLKHIVNLETNELINICRTDVLSLLGHKLSAEDEARMVLISGEAKKQNNLKKVAEILFLVCTGAKSAPGFVNEQPALDLINSNQEVVKKLKDFVQNVPTESFGNGGFKLAFDDFLQKNNYKMGLAGKVLRAILIGKADSVSISILFGAIGRDEALKRFLA